MKPTFVYTALIYFLLFSSLRKEIQEYFRSNQCCIEVKSTLNYVNLKSAYDNFLHTEGQLIMTSGFHDKYEKPQPHIVIKPKYSLFSFKAGYKEYTPTKILNLYKKIDPEWNINPLITSICIAGKGLFFQAWL